MEIKYCSHQCKDLFSENSTLIHSIHKPEARPNAQDLNAAPLLKNKVCVFVKKIKKLKTVLEDDSKENIDPKSFLRHH